MRVLTERLRGYWSSLYHRHTASAHTVGVWLVYLDHVLQDNARFPTFEEAEACAWLCRKREMPRVATAFIPARASHPRLLRQHRARNGPIR
jgi:hypothetical protein